MAQQKSEPAATICLPLLFILKASISIGQTCIGVALFRRPTEGICFTLLNHTLPDFDEQLKRLDLELELRACGSFSQLSLFEQPEA